MDGGAAAPAPVVHLEAFDVPLDLLLDLARAQKVDLACIAIADLVDPLVAAITAPGQSASLAQRSDWLVSARLTWLKSRLLLLGVGPEAEEARQEAEQLRALADWLAMAAAGSGCVWPRQAGGAGSGNAGEGRSVGPADRLLGDL